MNLCDLTLQDFRNYTRQTLEFDPGVNLIVGDNAQGKTNLLEAIVYLGSGKSFRAQRGAEMVRFGQDLADISGTVYSQERNQTLRAVIFSGRRSRQLWKNGVKLKSAEGLSGIMPTVLFCPEDLLVLKAGASARRRLVTADFASYGPIMTLLYPNTTGFWKKKAGFSRTALKIRR